MIQKIKQLKQENDFVILAHYYVDGSVQEIADYVGDSFYLSKIATGIYSRNILFAGVSFMGESAKLINPEKHVYYPRLQSWTLYSRTDAVKEFHFK